MLVGRHQKQDFEAYQKDMSYGASNGIGLALAKLKMIEEGYLVELPCKHGDIVYFIKSKFALAEKPIQGRISGVKLMNDGRVVYTAVTPSIDRHFCSDDIGKTVLLNYPEALEALEGMKK